MVVKGGSDFDPKGKSDREIMAFCQSFMTELWQITSEQIQTFLLVISELVQERSVTCSVSIREFVDFMKEFLTGKGLSYGGSLARTEATGYGLLYFTDEMLKCNGKSIKGATIAVLELVMLLFTQSRKLSS